MKQTVAQKRAVLYREWLLARLGNDERYYYSTLAYGIPDGEDVETVYDDIRCGEYDYDLDDLIDTYLTAKKWFSESGYWAGGQLVFNEETALILDGHSVLPERIYKKNY